MNNPDSPEACHRLPSNQNKKLKDAEIVLSKKTKLRDSILAVLVLKSVKSLSVKIFAAIVSSSGVNVKLYSQRNRLKLSELAMAK